MEDLSLKNLLIGQAKGNVSPFEFVDMSVKEPWDSKWKTNCRTKIRSCDGVIAIITLNTANADGQLWEIKCAKEEGIPIIGIWGYSDTKKRPTTLPAELKGVTIVDWTWANVDRWLKKL